MAAGSKPPWSLALQRIVVSETQTKSQLTQPVDDGAQPLASPFSGESPTSRDLIRRVLGLTWPVLVENFLQTMVGVVDTFMVSFLGTVALAGVGTSLPLVFVIFSAISAIGTGGAVLVAHSVGAKDLKTAAIAAKQAVLLGIMVSILLTSIGVPLARPIVGVLGPEERVLDIGSEYFAITMAASIGLVLMFVVGGVIRGAGDTRTPMLAGLAANIINVVVAYLLIFGNAGFPEMGPAGSAWAGALARLAGAGGLLIVLWRGRNGVSIRGISGWMFDRVMSARFLRIGLPAMLEQLMMSTSMIIFSAMVIGLGTISFAAQRITFQVLMVGWLPGFAFAIATTTLVGQALGARKPEEAARVTWIAVGAACLVLTGFGLVFLALGPHLSGLFSADPEIIELAGGSMRIMSLSMPLFGFVMVIQGALRGAGDTRFPMYVTGTLSLFFRLPVVWTIGYVFELGLVAMYGVFVFESFMHAVPAYIRFRSGGWKTRIV